MADRNRRPVVPSSLDAPRGAHELLDAVLEARREGLRVLDHDLRYVYVSSMAAREERRAPGELVGRLFSEAHAGIEQTSLFDRLRHVLATGDPSELTHELTHADGATTWLDVRLVAVPDGVAILSVDATRREVAELTLREARESFRATIDALADGVFITDALGRVTHVNPAASALLGRVSGEIEHQRLDRVVRLVRLANGEPADFSALDLLGGPVRFGLADGLLLERSDGARVAVAGSGGPIRTHAQRVLGAVMVLEDVTEQRQHTEQLHHAQKFESLGRLAGGISHDFNNLLTGILLAAQALRDSFDEQDQRCTDAEDILDAGQRGVRLVSQLLSFSPRSAGRPEVIDVGHALREMGQLLRRNLGRGIELVILTPAGASPVLIDRGQLDQVVLNLAVNARDAMPGGGTLTLRLSNVRVEETSVDVGEGDYAELCATDTGVGMDDHVRQRVFEPLFSTKGANGTGLGLSTCFGIVKQAGGTIAVESRVAEGSTFRVLLPRAMLVATGAGSEGP